MFKVQAYTRKPLSWWLENWDNLDLTPPFQRKFNIWSKSEKQLLIDSIFNDYDIPKFYISDNTYGASPVNGKKKMFSVIDGKQRLEAIHSFYKNVLPLASHFVYFDKPELKLAGLKYDEVQARFPEIARKFNDYEIAVITVITDEVGKINDMFIRLNKGSKALVGAEVRNANTAGATKFIRKLAGHKFFKNNIRFTITRMQEFNAVAKMLLIETTGRFVDTKKKNLDEWVTLTHANKIKDIYKNVKTNLDRLALVFEKEDSLLRSQGPLVLYYWLVRNHRGDNRKTLRRYLLEFNAVRKSNHDIAKVNPANADPEMSLYQSLSRSPNDESSMIRCYEVLEKRYEVFKKTKNSSASNN